MYRPRLFQEDAPDVVDALVRENPFATVITTVDGAPFVSHLPVLAERDAAGALVLTGHLARANPHWRHFGSETLFVFHGPHTYVSPSWYADPLNVPTWNYAVVHAFATPALVEEHADLRALLARMVDTFERSAPRPWPFALPEEFERNLVRGIVGFRARVTRVESKFKLSQNRDEADRKGVLQGLRERTDEQSRGVLALMTRR